MTADRLPTDFATIRSQVPGELRYDTTDPATTDLRLMRFAQQPYGERAVPPLDFHFLGVSSGRQDVRWRTIEGWQHIRTRQTIAFFMPAGVGSRWSNQGVLEPYHLYFAPRRVHSLAPDLQTPFEEILPRCTGGPWVAALAEHLNSLSDGESTLTTLDTDTLLLSIITVLLNAAPIQLHCGRRSGLAPWQLRRVQAKLLGELDRDISLVELAVLVNLSPTYLCTAFRDSTGLPPHQWQKRARVERAKLLLERSSATITEIALEVGYSNPGHFATMFRAALGVTPRAWRRERTS